MRRTLEKIKERKAITLIALVVTIVVLLILAGVSISLILDNNGIIQKSKDVKLETRASQVEDEVGLWKQNNFINKEAGKAQEEANTMLANLISRKLLTEDEIDREQEIITIKRKNGKILKQIEYGNVKINIRKTPATEKSGMVLLDVESVEGMTMQIKLGEESENFMKSLSNEQKKEIMKKIMINISQNCTTFQQALEYQYSIGNLREKTEEDFWKKIDSEEKLDNAIGDLLLPFFNKDTNTIEGYIITNPDNEISNTYVATENGIYKFKVKDIVTGKIYTKKIEVTNVDQNLSGLTIVEENELKVVGEKNEYGEIFIVLKNIETNECVDFQKAYILYNNKGIDITSVISNKDEKKGIVPLEIMRLLYNKGILEQKYVLANTDQIIILKKDNKNYVSIINMGDIRD